jgi:hypothetical protein
VSAGVARRGVDGVREWAVEGDVGVGVGGRGGRVVEMDDGWRERRKLGMDETDARERSDAYDAEVVSTCSSSSSSSSGNVAGKWCSVASNGSDGRFVLSLGRAMADGDVGGDGKSSKDTVREIIGGGGRG